MQADANAMRPGRRLAYISESLKRTFGILSACLTCKGKIITCNCTAPYKIFQRVYQLIADRLKPLLFNLKIKTVF